MKQLRPFLTALLGLTLWVQGLAIATAPVPVATADNAMEMPCHGDAGVSINPCDCCDDSCTDMAGCVVGSFAGAPFRPLQLAAATQAAVPATAWSPKTAVPPFPLRPPIVSHA